MPSTQNKLTTPRDEDWNNFWTREQSQQFCHVSWSKRRILQLLTPYVHAGDRALDAGCGSGFFSKYFVDQGMAVTALDYSWAALDITKHMTQRRVRAVQGDLLVEPLPPLLNDKFDVIFSDGLLEHFSKPDQDKIVQNLISVLNEKGFLITVVPNRWSPWEIIRPIFMPGIDEKPFVLGQLQDLNTRNGLKIVQQGGLNTLPFAFSPEGMAAKYFGMLLYTVAQQK